MIYTIVLVSLSGGIGGVLGAVTFSGGAATISYAQNNNVSTKVE